MSIQQEIWKPIPSFDGYEVSNLGRVRSYLKQVPGRPRGHQWIIATSPQRILSTKARTSSTGYPAVHLRGQSIPVHRLVMLAFNGPPADGNIVCHNDGNPENNRLDNLRYDTPQSNTRDAVNQGTIYPGFNGKFNEQQVIAIRTLAAQGKHPVELAEKYNVLSSTIASLCRGETYTVYGGPLTFSWPFYAASNARRKLSEEDVADIRQQARNGTIQRVLADEYNVSESCISRIVRGNRR